MLLYLTKISISLILTYLLYKWILEDLKIHRFKRFYLLFSMIFSLILPLISIPNHSLDLVFDSKISEINEIIITPSAMRETTQSSPFLTLQTLLYLVYLVGFAIAFFKFCKGIYDLNRLRKKGQSVQKHQYHFVLLPFLKTPFTFGKYIYLPQDTAIDFSDTIIRHELVHVNQRHTIDILLTELLKCMFWFHPMFYLFKNSIALNHEFLADNQIIRNQSEADNYLQLLLHQTYQQNEMSLSSSFNFNLTKKRFIMISKNNNPLKNALSIVLACVVIIFTGIISTQAQEKKTATTQVQEKPLIAVEKQAEYVGGMDAFQNYFINNFRIDEATEGKNIGKKTTIIVQFIIEKDGSVNDINILRSELSEQGNQNIISIMKNCPKWIPAKHHDKVVRSQFTLPITIQVQDDVKKDA
ncbi:M56 family metallopeptidase [Myroides indicus]|uniref:Beta-lactamase regulating signal transducer with metallopeptidase domain n=1 Tax=Myroides indicus TaxID=1323422 RepID=A0A4R7F0W8_9FLAO|nr:M56 family metallopeptidase [Myroides indicus]TDS62067.1 beta-lactamase regulating signal transducer with metallopeptidase domain [Myroides indicus]